MDALVKDTKALIIPLGNLRNILQQIEQKFKVETTAVCLIEELNKTTKIDILYVAVPPIGNLKEYTVKIFPITPTTINMVTIYLTMCYQLYMENMHLAGQIFNWEDGPITKWEKAGRPKFDEAEISGMLKSYVEKKEQYESGNLKIESSTD